MDKYLVDSFLFFNEIKLLNYRLNLLDPIVDFFVISESPKTFTGEKKPLFFDENREMFDKFKNKIIYNLISEENIDFNNWSELPNFRNHNSSFFYDLPERFHRDSYQRDYTIKGIKNVPSNSLILMSDLDEIPNPEILSGLKYSQSEVGPWCFLQTMHYYAPKYVSNDIWFGTRAIKFNDLMLTTVDTLRQPAETNLMKLIPFGGWHFSFFGGLESIKYKIKSYTHAEYYTKEILENLELRIDSGKDLFGRKIEFQEKSKNLKIPMEYLLD